MSDGASIRDLLETMRLSQLDRRILDFYALHLGKFVGHERVINAVYGHDSNGGPDNPDNVIAVRLHHMRPTLAQRGLGFEATSGSRRLLRTTTIAVAPARVNGNGHAAAPPPPASPVPLPRSAGEESRVGGAIGEDAILLGEADGGWPVGIDLQKLVEGRCLVQGTSGAGKSWTLRRILEQTAGRLQQIIVDPEGEFRGLAEAHGHLVLAGHALDAATLAIAARRVREHRLSVLLDLSELPREAQMMALSAFFEGLIDAPREHWHPVLVAVDEAHLFAPFGGQRGEASSVRKAAIAALVDLMSRGRKRGLCGVLATQRLARLSKSVASEVQNFLIGLNTLDLDIRRAADTIGWDSRRAFDRLPLLTPGRFIAVGPAFSDSPATLKVGGVETKHWGAAPVIAAPAAHHPGEAAKLLGLDDLVAASAADEALRNEAAVSPGFRAVRAFLREPAFADAGLILAALAGLAPEGAAIAELAPFLERTPAAVAAALALLDVYGVLEFSGEDDARAVRLEKAMIKPSAAPPPPASPVPLTRFAGEESPAVAEYAHG